MNSNCPSTPRWLPIYCRLAGSADAATGLMLMTMPSLTLRVMGAGQPVDPIWVRWVGVFVFAVGVAYWLPELRARHLQACRRIAALEFTTLVRLAVAAFVAWALVDGRLEPAFASVLATDLSLGVTQLAMLRALHRKMTP